MADAATADSGALAAAEQGSSGPVARDPASPTSHPASAETDARAGASSDGEERAEGEAEASGLGPLSVRQAEEVVAAVEAVRASGLSRHAVKHGWSISFNVRKPVGGRGSRGAPRGDLCIIDPRDGNKYASVVSLKRRLGLVDAVEPAAPAPRRAAAQAEPLMAEAEEEELARRPRRSRAQVGVRGRRGGWKE